MEGTDPTSSGFVLGVQWHPEQGDDLRVMRALVRAAAAVASPIQGEDVMAPVGG